MLPQQKHPLKQNILNSECYPNKKHPLKQNILRRKCSPYKNISSFKNIFTSKCSSNKNIPSYKKFSCQIVPPTKKSPQTKHSQDLMFPHQKHPLIQNVLKTNFSKTPKTYLHTKHPHHKMLSNRIIP